MTPRNVEVALAVLAADLNERDPFVLVLDDVHLVTAKRSRSILGSCRSRARRRTPRQGFRAARTNLLPASGTRGATPDGDG